MEKTSIPRLLLKLAPPVMLSLLIQSIYNLVDSIFIGRYSDAGLTALSIIYPIQLLLTALATGIGTGAGILVSHADGSGKKGCQGDIAVSALAISIGHAVIVTNLRAGAVGQLFRAFFSAGSGPSVRAGLWKNCSAVFAGMLYSGDSGKALAG